jgi:4-hydroxybenzoate polyprenyltransferase
MGVRAALVFTAALLLTGLVILLQFNFLTICVGLLSVPLFMLYPLAKRVMWWPQLVLGLTFNWGALLGWSAVRGELGLPALLLYVAGVFWTLAYDTIYAHQDKEDDARIGVKSLALWLGDKSLFWIAGFFDAFFFLTLLAGWFAGVGTGFYVTLCAALLHALWQLMSWRIEDPASSLAKFRSNRDFGLIVLAAILAGHIF